MRKLGVVALLLMAGGFSGHLSSLALAQTGAPASPGAQAVAQKPGTGFIFGQVLDAGTGQPLAGATVTLAGGPPPVLNGAPPPPDSPQLLDAMAAARNASRLMTGSSGQFVFHDLHRGNYRVSVSAPGYIPGSYGQRIVNGPSQAIELAEDDHVSDATIKLWKYASVSGRVVDEAGEPAVGLSVRVLRVSGSGKRRTLQPLTQTQTDDRGIYRIGTLAPAEYLVAIPQTVTTMPTTVIDTYMTAMSGGNTVDLIKQLSESSAPMPMIGSGMRLGDFQVSAAGASRALTLPAPDPDHVSVYQSLFYPAATTSTDATPITLRSGQDQTGIDFQLRIVSTVRVSGSVTGSDGPARNTGVRLLNAGVQDIEFDNGFETATSVTDATGAFTFLGVPSGQYVLKVQRVSRPLPDQSSMVMVTTTMGGGGMSSIGFSSSMLDPSASLPPVSLEPTFFGQTSVAVADHSIEGVTVALRPGIRVSGTLVFEGSATPPTPDALSRFTVSLSAVEGRSPIAISSTRPSPDGRFKTQGYPPGRYFVNAGGPLPPGWTLRSISLGGRNLDDTALELESDDIAGVTVVFSDQTTEIRGTVHGGTGAAAGEGDATVLVFPANYTAWMDQGSNGRRQRTGGTTKNGGYSISGLPPGDYLVVAVSSDGVPTNRDAAFYGSIARGATHITLAQGEKKPLDLTLSVIR